MTQRQMTDVYLRNKIEYWIHLAKHEPESQRRIEIGQELRKYADEYRHLTGRYFMTRG